MDKAYTKISRKELVKSLRLVILAYAFGVSFFVVQTGSPFTGFTRLLGAGDLIYGIIMAMPVVGGVMQVFASYFLENTGKRKAIFIGFASIQRLLWIPVAIIPLIIPPDYNVVRIWAVTVLITISSITGSMSSVAFMSWMGALVPPEIKGRFFSRRMAICTFIGALGGMGAGLLLDAVPGFNGFALLYVIAAILGTLDIVCFFWIKDPPMERPSEKIPFTRLFIEPFSNKNYLRYMIFVSVWNFGVNFSSPFFNVYMLEELRMSYFTITLFAQVLGNLTTVVSVHLWGKVADKYGNKTLLKLCGLLVMPLPILWWFTNPENYWIILFINFMSGLTWPGIDIGILNLSIWLAPEKNRSIYIANYTLVTSLFGIALAYVCGGAFMQYTKPLFEQLSIPFFMGQKLSSYHVMFLLTSFMRLISIVVFLPWVHENDSKDLKVLLRNVAGAIKAKTGLSIGK